MSEIESNINKLIKLELQKWFPTLEFKDGWDWNIQQISADSCVSFTEYIVEKVFEATKKACADNAEIVVNLPESVRQNTYIYELDKESILNLEIEDLEL
jgi:hypothetical protein